MNIHTLAWYTPILIEANKFWFYAICASIIRTVVQRAGLFSGRASASSAKDKIQAPPLRRLIIDALDLTLPASFIGWVVLDDVTIGCFMTVSTLLVWKDIWNRAQ